MATNDRGGPVQIPPLAGPSTGAIVVRVCRMQRENYTYGFFCDGCDAPPWKLERERAVLQRCEACGAMGTVEEPFRPPRSKGKLTAEPAAEVRAARETKERRKAAARAVIDRDEQETARRLAALREVKSRIAADTRLVRLAELRASGKSLSEAFTTIEQEDRK